MNKTQNDEAWEILFERHHILEHIDREGKFVISADAIKEEREPRLMAKFDHRINLPQIFLDNHLAILPISRGKYVISNFEAYKEFPKSEEKVWEASLPDHIESLDAQDVHSEMIAINCAVASGIMADFFGEDTLYSTVSGRMGSGQFEFQINNTKMNCPTAIAVENAQIEIDAALEGLESLALIEAKQELSRDFLIRQLYYPFRVWSARIKKPVRPVFLVYSNGVFTLYEYCFEEPCSYNSLVCRKQKSYILGKPIQSIADLQLISQRTARVQDNLDVPFPQADSFERIVNLCELLSARAMTKEEITGKYLFVPRQTDYYTNALIYLGLAEKYYDENHTLFLRLTENGNTVMRLPLYKRQYAFCEVILSHDLFRRVFNQYMDMGDMPSKTEIVALMRGNGVHDIGGDTLNRRASTIAGWVRWIVGLVEE